MALSLVAVLWTAPAAFALEPEEQLPDARLEARARTISRELRCVVCQSQTIDDSEAPVAKALRKLVRDRLLAGDDDRQVIAAVTARYGDFVLLKPRFETTTALLWLGPFLLLLAGGAAAAVYVRRQSQAPEAEPAPLTAEEARLLETVRMADQTRPGAAEG